MIKTVLIAALASTAAYIATGCAKQKGEVEAVTRFVKAMRGGRRGNFPALAPRQGKASNEVNLSFGLSGPLVALPVNVGDRVKAGQMPARIDPRDP